MANRFKMDAIRAIEDGSPYYVGELPEKFGRSNQWWWRCRKAWNVVGQKMLSGSSVRAMIKNPNGIQL